jgi:hypothetical protein
VKGDLLTNSDFIFYTDKANNFYIDYTDGGIGDDIIEIAKGKYNGATTIKLDTETIHINEIIQALGAEYKGLDADATGLIYFDKSTQAHDMIAANWNN